MAEPLQWALEVYASGQHHLKAALASTGVPFGVIFFFTCIILTVPASYPLRVLKGATKRHLYSAVSGITLCFIAFDALGCSQLLLSLLYSYAVLCMPSLRRRCGLITAALAFTHLVTWCGRRNRSSTLGHASEGVHGDWFALIARVLYLCTENVLERESVIYVLFVG